MNQRHDQHSPEQRALDALKKMPALKAPDTTRARARQAFFIDPDTVVTEDDASVGVRGSVWTAVAAAAAVVALLIYGAMPNGHWIVTQAEPASAISIVGHTPELGQTFAGGSVQTAADCEFELTLDGIMRMRFRPDTQAEVPSTPARWFNRDRELLVEAGEVFGTTDGPLGFSFRLRTPEATADLVGTTFAVIRNAEATCFCLYEGSIEFTPLATGQAATLPVGKRVTIYRDGRPALIEPIDGGEQMKLQMIQDAGTGIAPD